MATKFEARVRLKDYVCGYAVAMRCVPWLCLGFHRSGTITNVIELLIFFKCQKASKLYGGHGVMKMLQNRHVDY